MKGTVQCSAFIIDPLWKERLVIKEEDAKAADGPLKMPSSQGRPSAGRCKAG